MRIFARTKQIADDGRAAEVGAGTPGWPRRWPGRSAPDRAFSSASRRSRSGWISRLGFFRFEVVARHVVAGVVLGLSGGGCGVMLGTGAEPAVSGSQSDGLAVDPEARSSESPSTAADAGGEGSSAQSPAVPAVTGEREPAYDPLAAEARAGQLAEAPHDADPVPVARASFVLPPFGAPAGQPVLDAEGEAWVERSLASLDLRQKVAQLILAWIPGGRIPENSAEFRRVRRWIEEDQVGGLIVSTGRAGEFAPMLSRLQALAPVPLLIVSDLETGPGMRLQGGTSMPPAMAFGAAGSVELAHAAGRVTAIEARAAGIHMTLGPVLDVNSNPYNPIINTRSFGGEARRVAALAAAWIEGARSEGLMTVGKHFPGHGATEVDSHMGLPTLWAPLEELDSIDLPPFVAAIDHGMDAVLVGHIAVPAIDGADAPPASLSPGVIGGLLRERLGFDGLVFTDALNMGGVTEHYAVPEAAVLALEAGADVLLQPPGERVVIDSVVAAVVSGRLSEERINASVRRVLATKAKAGLHLGLASRPVGGAAPGEHEGVAEAVAAASLALVRNERNLVPLPDAAVNILHVAYQLDGSPFDGASLTASLRAAGRAVETVTIGDGRGTDDLERVGERARRADLVLVSTNLVPREYRGPLSLQTEFSRFVEELVAVGVPVVAISFGSPYLLDYFPSISTYLLAWGGAPLIQRAVARALLGEADITGQVPVMMP